MKKSLILIITFVLSITAQAQLNRSAYGLYGHYVYSIHEASFQSLPNLPCCSQIFKDGKGSGIDVGALYQTPLSSAWTLSARLGYMSFGGTLINDEATTINIDGKAVPGTIRHQIDPSLATIQIEPLIGYRLTERFTLHGGLLIGTMLTRTFEQTETLTEPMFNPLIGGTRLTTPTRVGGGELQNASSLYAAATLGLSFDIPIGRGSRWFLAPEAFYSLGLLNVVNDRDWKVNNLRVGIALKYSPSDLEMPAAPPGQKSKLLAAVKAYGMESPTSIEEAIVKLKVEEFSRRTHKPLLPYVFFGSGSAELPLQYQQLTPAQTASFTTQRFTDSSLLGVYYDMLNIVGRRLKDRPDAKLNLVGCNSNESSEKANLALSQRRAETVKNYLVNAWGIDASRIDIKPRNLPANPSNINKDEGVAENRRVEIASNDPEIIAPLITRDTTRVSSPPIVRFSSRVESEAGLGAYSLAATQDNRLLQAFNANGDVPDNIDWRLEDNPTSVPRAETPLVYTLRVTDHGGQEYVTNAQQIPVEQITIAKKIRERLGDKEIDRYTLMSFGFNQAEVEPDNRRYLDQIRKDITDNSTVRIVGSTDTMGEEDFNMNLSQQRAKSVANALNANKADVRGIGEQAMYDNSLPEGRFYNRTVRLVIETPVQR